MIVKESGASIETVRKIDEKISSLKKEREMELHKAIYDDFANSTRAMYQSFVDVGFNDEQAYELLKMSLEKGIK